VEKRNIFPEWKLIGIMPRAPMCCGRQIQGDGYGSQRCSTEIGSEVVRRQWVAPAIKLVGNQRDKGVDWAANPIRFSDSCHRWRERVRQEHGPSGSGVLLPEYWTARPPLSD
jgi:hypothetical protein